MVRIRALDLLARREHSRSELRGKLLRRGFAEAAVTTVLDDLAAEGLQSDGRFAEAYVCSRTERGFGPVAIAEDLRRRGLRGAARDAACDPRDPHWSARAREVRRKRFGEAAPQSPGERARQIRFLTRRGFTRDQVRAAFDAGLDLDEAP